jgi:hypothetical protein
MRKPVIDALACPAQVTQKSNEWYTPARYVEAARQVMGTIDLDPASCEVANRTVKATRYYTKEDNGLAYPWHGNVWLNPPYGRVHGSGASVIRMFVTKLMDEYQSGSIRQAILLTAVQTNSTWFQPLWQFPICFTSHQVAFIKLINGRLTPDGVTSHTLGTALVYLGTNEQQFIDLFSQFGTIAKRVNPIPPSSSPATLWENNQ